MASSISPSHLELNRTWFHRWIYYLATGLMFAAATIRSILIHQNAAFFYQVLALLALWLLAFILNAILASRMPWLSIVLISLEILIILRLVMVTGTDFLAYLFAIPGMQVMQKHSMRAAILVAGITTILMLLSLYPHYGIFDAIGTVLVFFGGSLFLVIYIGATRRAGEIEVQQQQLVGELQKANQQLESHAEQMEQLAASRERQRLARDLHDSVTQTIFSMTLTTQSALLLLEKDPKQVPIQLERLYQLSHNALAEMQALISRLAPETAGGFLSALRQHLAERRRLDNLGVSLEAEGDQRLSAAEEQSLFRITQEALNNVVKHAGVDHAAIQLHLQEPFWMEINDLGRGFDPLQAPANGQVGLQSMQERAAGIGWNLQVDSAPGDGTRIRVWKGPKGAKPP